MQSLPKSPCRTSRLYPTSEGSIVDRNISIYSKVSLLFRNRPFVPHVIKHIAKTSVLSAFTVTGLWKSSASKAVVTINLFASSEHLGFALILSLKRLMNPCLFVGFVRNTFAGRSSTVPSFTTKSRVLVEF